MSDEHNEFINDVDDLPGREPSDVGPEVAPQPTEPINEPVEPGPLPAYLRQLSELPGVDTEAFDGVKLRRAWVKIEGEDGSTKTMPLAHLAPEALDVLEDLGFEGHTMFELRPSSNGPAVGYFACRLREPDEPDAPEGGQPGIDPHLLQIVKAQQAQINALAEKLNRDPMDDLEKMLGAFGRVSKAVQKMIPQAPPAPSGGLDLSTVIDVVGQVVNAKNQLSGDNVELPDEPPPEAPADE